MGSSRIRYYYDEMKASGMSDAEINETIEKCNVCDSYTNPKDCEACDGTGKVVLNQESPCPLMNCSYCTFEVKE